jgi:NDP-sugar pyrophosphorylase family protein
VAQSTANRLESFRAEFCCCNRLFLTSVTDNLTAVIIGGGHGECLRVADEYVPKVLLPVGGRPLLELQLEWLKRAGIDSAVLCLDYKPEAVRARFGDGSDFGIRLRYSVDESPRGTAGLVKVLGPASLPDDVLVFFGEIYPETDCSRMIRFHRSHAGLASLALHDCRQGRPAASGPCRGGKSPCSQLHGCAGESVVLGPAQQVIDFPLYPPEGKSGMALSPLWIIRRGIFRFVSDGPASDFVKDVFPAAVKAGEALMGYHETGILSDLGSPERYERFCRVPARKR